MANVLVLGAQGMLGNYVVSYLRSVGHKVTPTTHHKNVMNMSYFDATKLCTVPHSDVIVNCIGAIPQKFDNSHVDKYWSLNVDLPRYLASLGRRVIHVGTDCIFGGKSGRYTEDSIPNPVDLYGASKYLGEVHDLAYVKIIRTSIIGDTSVQGLLGWYINADKNNKVAGYTNHKWNGVTCLQLAKEIEKDINSWWSTPSLRHYHSPEDVSKYQLLSYIKEVYGNTPDIVPQESFLAIDRTLRSNMAFNMPPSIPQQLEEMRDWRF